MPSRHPFDTDTAVTDTGGGRYTATVTDRWSLIGGYANGGYGLAICLQALRAAQAEHPDPVAVSATYLRRLDPGPAQVLVEPIRSGRRLSVAGARLIQDGKERIRVVANFADLGSASGPTALRNCAPRLPPPEDCVELTTEPGLPALSLGERLEYRYPQLPGWRCGQPAGRLDEQFWMRFAPDPQAGVRDADTLAAAVLVDMGCPPVLDLGEFGSTTIELTVHVRARPAPGWLACRASTRHLIDGYHDEDFEIWDSTGQLVAQSRQLALLPRE
ncbi:MAG: thioesterase family protein [Actinomycetota bacterium]|nr:thioesterase family protein [Actinomycetota bacterium]